MVQPIFVLICILATIICGAIITGLTNQTTGNESNLQNQSNLQTPSVIKQRVESTSINNENTKKKQIPTQKKYWYTLGGKIHNSTCQYYGKTEGFYTDGQINKSNCQYCGGRSLPQDYDNLRQTMQKRSINRNSDSN